MDGLWKGPMILDLRLALRLIGWNLLLTAVLMAISSYLDGVYSLVWSRTCTQYRIRGVQKVEIDSFSGYRIYPSKGKLFVRGDSKVSHILSLSHYMFLINPPRSSDFQTARMSRCSCSAKTRARLPGRRSTVACTRRVSRRRLRRSARAGL